MGKLRFSMNLLFGLLLLMNAAAQSRGVETVSLRVLATGQPPTTEIEVRGDEGSVEKEVDAKLLPPRALYLKSGRNDYEALRISLGVMSASAKGEVQGSQLTLYRRQGTAERPSYQAWGRISIPKGSKEGTLLMYQDPKKKDWTKPIMRYLSDDSSAFPKGALRLINTSAFQMSVQLGEVEKVLDPGEVVVEKGLARGEPVRYLVNASVKGKRLKIANSALVLEGRASLVMAPQDKANSRRPARVTVYQDAS